MRFILCGKRRAVQQKHSRALVDLRTSGARSLQCCLEALKQGQGLSHRGRGRGEGEEARWLINGPLRFQLGNFQ